MQRRFTVVVAFVKAIDPAWHISDVVFTHHFGDRRAGLIKNHTLVRYQDRPGGPLL